MPIIKTMPVVDCQDFPKDVRKYFFDHSYAGNDCYVEYYLEGDDEGDLVVRYLREIGFQGDEIIIRHWW